MRKNISILLTILILILSLVGCSDANNVNDFVSQNAFESFNSEDDNIASESIAVASEVVCVENMQFEYNGFPIEFDYKFNASGDCEMGLELYVNGIMQKFFVDGVEYSLYKTICEKDKDNQFHIVFEPNNGVEGETSTLVFANVYNPEIISSSNKVNSFGNNQNISQPLPWGIKMKSAPKKEREYNITVDCKSQKLSKEEIATYERKMPDGSTSNKLDDSMIFDGNSDYSTINIRDLKSFDFNLLGNITGRYRVSLYGDFERIDMNGSDYVDIDVEKNMKYTISINTEDLKDYENVYAVAIALDNTEGLIKSSSYFIEK